MRESGRGGDERVLQAESLLCCCWRRRIGEDMEWSWGDALSASLKELRCVSTPRSLQVTSSGIHSRFREADVPRSSTHLSDGQRSSGSQSGIIVLVCPRESSPSLLPGRSLLGLLPSSTPFVTGRPTMLIFNGTVKSSSAVGLALSAGPRSVSQTSFPSLLAIPALLRVTQSDGNPTSELDKANPTALLISAMEKSATKDEFYPFSGRSARW
ncbi:hypothetical protein EI94DRAFT_1279949 [Lactarius quietus]|nr:hypothetical protein EI94DRAFT_1279949 [Lactarius quietus]